MRGWQRVTANLEQVPVAKAFKVTANAPISQPDRPFDRPKSLRQFTPTILELFWNDMMDALSRHYRRCLDTYLQRRSFKRYTISDPLVDLRIIDSVVDIVTNEKHLFSKRYSSLFYVKHF